jgi:hypothetical protein
MQAFFKRLSVPDACVKVLVNEQATREAIVQALKDLASLENGIDEDDPIVIYFAGHGSTVPAPPDLEPNDSKVRVLVPQDGCRSADGRVTNVIMDITLGRLLQELATAKAIALQVFPFAFEPTLMRKL